MKVDEVSSLRDLVLGRRSVRSFVDKPVDQKLIQQILEDASWAPSGCNLQPWHVYVITDKAIDRLASAVQTKMMTMSAALQEGEGADFEFLPDPMPKKLRKRQIEAAVQLYNALGIERSDKEARLRAAADNFNFFGAPVGYIFTMKKGSTPGQFMDIGMYMQNVMLLAEANGLRTCAQEAWAIWANTVRETLSVSDDEMIVCGMAMGYGDIKHPVNSFKTKREAVDTFVQWKSE